MVPPKLSLLALAATALAAPVAQVPLGGDNVEAFHGSLSSWARAVKNRFLGDLSACAPSILANTSAQSTACAQVAQWSIVMGNEAGDLDSLTSAIAWAFYLAHQDLDDKSGLKGKKNKKGMHSDKWEERLVVPLLQTEEDAIDLRPENKLALREYGSMRRGHADILSEFATTFSLYATFILIRFQPSMTYLSHRASWLHTSQASISWTITEFVPIGAKREPRQSREFLTITTILVRLSISPPRQIFQLMISSTSGLYPNAEPRVIEPSGSCASLVVHEILDLWDKDGGDLAFEGECINVSMDPNLRFARRCYLTDVIPRTLSSDKQRQCSESAPD